MKNELPLQGIKVLDLCIVLAGPTCGRTLSQYGAEVIKIDPEHRPPQLTPWLDVGRGKKSICLNIKKPGGLEAFLELAKTADVVIEGFRKGVTERLGIGYDALKRLNPGIIYGSINCFGQDGPWSLRPGFEQNAQAATGIQIRNGGIDGKPRPATYTLNDYGTGLAAAYAVMLALLERQNTGKGQRVDASLSQTSAMISGPLHTKYEGLNPSNHGGPGIRGTSIANRLYEVSDGWIFLSAVRDEEWSRLRAIKEFAFLDISPAEHQHEEMERLFTTNNSEYWLSLLSASDVPAVMHMSTDDVYADDLNRRRGIIIDNPEITTSNYPEWGHVAWAGNPITISTTGKSEVYPRAFGEDTIDVLLSAGLSQESINDLISNGAIPETLPIGLQ